MTRSRFSKLEVIEGFAAAVAEGDPDACAAVARGILRHARIHLGIRACIQTAPGCDRLARNQGARIRKHNP